MLKCHLLSEQHDGQVNESATRHTAPAVCDPLHETSRSGHEGTATEYFARAGRLLLLHQSLSPSLPLANLNVTFVCSATFWPRISRACGAAMRIHGQIRLCTQIQVSASVCSGAFFCKAATTPLLSCYAIITWGCRTCLITLYCEQHCNYSSSV